MTVIPSQILPGQIPRLGLMAGAGSGPILVAQAAARIGLPITAFAVKGITNPELGNLVDEIHWLNLGQFSLLIKILHQKEIRHLVMVGHIPHNAIWRYRGFDVRALRILGKMVNRKADGLLGAVVEEFQRENIMVLDSTLLLRNNMPGKGLLTPNRPPTKREEEDIAFGLPIAREIGRLDIGQTIVVKDKAVVAVESLEGTDETILRAGRIAAGDIVVIKVAKPQQDSRFDVPVIGPHTIDSIQQAGGGVLAIMGDSTLFFDEKEAIRKAQEANITIIAV